ncbi:MAG: hypothetical protein PHV13_02335 [Candidatus ainarchaeum sp.]|nr:hypothetical protein [Candidatus ainarchaeum sp.]
MEAKDAVGIFNGPIKFVEDIAGFLVKPLLGIWGIIIWLVEAWCELIVTALAILGWLAAIAAFFLMATGAWLFGGIALVAALFLFAGREFFNLVEFWLSGKGYTTAPAKFVGDIVGTIIGFALFYGLLLAVYIFLFPMNWLLAAIIVFASKSVLSSIARFIRHFLAMLKDQVGGKPK